MNKRPSLATAVAAGLHLDIAAVLSDVCKQPLVTNWPVWVTEGLKSFLLSLIGNEKDTCRFYLKSVSDHSYLHELGFFKIPIIVNDDGSNIRLHFHGFSEKNSIDVHDHLFDMRSLIIKGSIYSVDWVDCRNGSDFVEYNLSPRSGGSYILEKQGLSRLKAQKKWVVNEGQDYSLRAGSLHCSGSTKKAISMMVASSRRVLRNRIFVPIGNPEKLDFDSRPLSVNEVSKIIVSLR